jgi:hypothetical protein
MKRNSMKYVVLGCGVLLLAVLSVGAARTHSLQPAATQSQSGFLAAVDDFTVSGNLDYSDDFNDGSRDTLPSSLLLDSQPFPLDQSVGRTGTAEMGGYLVLEGGGSGSLSPAATAANPILATSAKSEKFVRGPLAGSVRDTVFLDEPISDGGAGLTTVTASFAAEVPRDAVAACPAAEAYGMFLAGANEATQAFAGVYLKATSAGANAVQLSFVDQDSKVIDRAVIHDFDTTVGRDLVLRLTVDHLADTVAPSYSVDGGTTFAKFDNGATAKVYSSDIGDKVYAGVLAEGPAPDAAPASPVSYLALLATGLLIGTATVFVMFRVR